MHTLIRLIPPLKGASLGLQIDLRVKSRDASVIETQYFPLTWLLRLYPPALLWTGFLDPS
jgi:hypothetical protein